MSLFPSRAAQSALNRVLARCSRKLNIIQALRRLCRMHPGMDAGIRVDDLPRLHDLLEAAQIALHLLLRLLAEKLGNQRSQLSSWRLVAKLDMDLGAAVTRRVLEPHGPGVGDGGVRQRAPGNHLVGAVFNGLRIPLDCGAGRSLCLPVGTVVVQYFYRFEVSHEAGEVLEVMPEPVHLVPGTLDGQGMSDVNSARQLTVLLHHPGPIGPMLTAAVSSLPAQLLAGEEVHHGNAGDSGGGCGNPVP